MTAEFVVATHAVVLLNRDKRPLSSEEIAKNVCTNPARVRKVLLKLKKAGIVETHGGFTGGYAFTADPESVTLKDIFLATGKHFVKVSWRSGSAEKDCPISRAMAPVMDEIFDSLDDCCGEKLAQITVADVDRRIPLGIVPGGSHKE